MSFVVAHEAAPADESAEDALDDPASRNDIKPWLGGGPAEDLDDEVEATGLLNELCAIVSAVGEDVLHERPALADRVE